MALDGIVTRAVVHELQSCVGARIHKIHQPTEHDLVLQIRGGSAPGRLLLSANPTYPRVHWTGRAYVNPLEAPMFCMLMRKHCEGGVIESVKQVGAERIIRIGIRQRDELGDVSLKTIVVELMGRHSNIILLDQGSNTIHDGIHHVTPAISSYRIVMPGTVYTAPPAQGKTDPFSIGTEAEFAAALPGPGKAEDGIRADKAEGITEADNKPDGKLSDNIPAPGGKSEPADKLLVGAFSGLSPLLAKEIVFRSRQIAPSNGTQSGGGAQTDGSIRLDSAVQSPDRAASSTSALQTDSAAPGGQQNYTAAAALWPAFRAMMEQFAAHRYEPQIAADEARGKAFFSVTRLSHIAAEADAERFDSVSGCLEAFYGDKAQRDTVKQRVSDLIRFLQNERDKNEKKLTRLHETIEEARDADKYRVLGELLTTCMHQIKRGDNAVETVNYYEEDQPAIRIELDPQLSPSENAQRYFKKYTKHKNSLAVVAEQIERTHEEIAYLDSLLQQLASAELSDIDEIREELVQGGYLRDRGKRGARKKKQARPALLCYTSSEGIPIYVGKNNTQNEYLTNKLAAPGDTWLHTKDIPGSHVVIRSNAFGDDTLEEAAMLAAHYSQARSSSLVPVDYTLIRHVKKPSGAKPGFVIYDHQKTLFITPDEQRLKRLPAEVKS